jgi:hypothetical protein
MEENQEVTQVEDVQEQAPEKMLTQSQVNAIVQREKQQAASRATQQAELQYQQRMEQLQSQQQATQQQQTQDIQPVMQQSKDVSADSMYQQVQERFNKEMQQKQVESEIAQVAQNYLQKMSSGKESYDDFEQVTADFDPSAFPQLVYLVAGMDNAAEVIYDLAKNSSKLITLDALALKSPRQASAELHRLSKSISDNKQAQSEAGVQQVNAPLDRMQPSRVSSGSGPMSINDLRAQPWLRG